MRIAKLNGWNYSYPTRPAEWMVAKRKCAKRLTYWLEATIGLLMQGMPLWEAKRWWKDSVALQLDQEPYCTDALDTETIAEAYVVLTRVRWILAGAKFFEGLRSKGSDPTVFYTAQMPFSRSGSAIDANTLAGEAEEHQFRKLNRL